jgi:hypothetical protein
MVSESSSIQILSRPFLNSGRLKDTREKTSESTLISATLEKASFLKTRYEGSCMIYICPNTIENEPLGAKGPRWWEKKSARKTLAK